MDCRKFLEEFSEYIDGESSAGIRQAIEEHIAFCRKCEVIYSSTRRTLQIVGDCSEQTFELPPEVSNRLYARVRARLKDLQK
jgi:predicted anti-sigma-YlaC factor YlaD